MGNYHILPLYLEKIFAFRSTFFIELVPFVIVSGCIASASHAGRIRIAVINVRNIQDTFRKRSLIKDRQFHAAVSTRDSSSCSRHLRSLQCGIDRADTVSNFTLLANYAMMIDSTRWRNSSRNGLAIMIFRLLFTKCRPCVEFHTCVRGDHRLWNIIIIIVVIIIIISLYRVYLLISENCRPTLTFYFRIVN